MEINIGQLLSYRAQNFPHHEAVVDLYQQTRFTYQEYNDRVNQLVHWFTKENLKTEDRVAMICKNSTTLATIFYAAAKAGIISLPLNWRLTVDELKFILEDSQPKVIFYDEVFADQIIKLKTYKWAMDITFIRIGTIKSAIIDPAFETILNGQPTDEPKMTSSGHDSALIMYTSGTTGKPKGVIMTHDNIWSNAVGVASFLDWRASDRFLSVAPMFHIGGIILDVTSLFQRSTVIYMHEFHPHYIWDIIEQEQINQFMSVPVMLKLMLDDSDWLTKNIDSLRYILCGASSVPPQLIEQYNSYGIPLVQVYGCTEYTGAITIWSEDIGLQKHTTMGKPLFHTQVKIVEPGTNKEVGTDQIGEIICKGPCTFKGYWKQPVETEKAILNNWYYTGDLGKIDQDGFLTVIDRYKDMFVSGGENIYPAEIEAVLSNIDGIEEVAVIGVPDPKWGESPKIYAVKSADSTITKQDIIQHCQGRLAKFKYGKEVEFIDSLPKNAVGKVLKRELRKHHQNKNRQ